MDDRDPDALPTRQPAWDERWVCRLWYADLPGRPPQALDWAEFREAQGVIPSFLALERRRTPSVRFVGFSGVGGGPDARSPPATTTSDAGMGDAGEHRVKRGLVLRWRRLFDGAARTNQQAIAHNGPIRTTDRMSG